MVSPNASTAQRGQAVVPGSSPYIVRGSGFRPAQWKLLHWKQKEQVRLLKCIRTVCDLANCVDSLSNGEMVQMVRWACWSPLSSTDPSNIGQTRKSTC